MNRFEILTLLIKYSSASIKDIFNENSKKFKE